MPTKSRPTTPVSFTFDQQLALPTRKRSVSDFRYRGEPIPLDNWQPSPPLFSAPPTESTLKHALVRIIEQLFGMGDVSYETAVPGAYNQIYIFRIGNKRNPNSPETVLCRLSRPSKVNSLLSVRSEVETMMYVRNRMSVPIPQVYAYGTTCSLLGTTFIIMQHITNASPLSAVLPILAPSAKQELARQYARIVFQLSQMRFTHMGSIRQDKNGSGTFGVGSMSLPRPDRVARMTTSTYRSTRVSFPSVQEWAEALERTELKFLEEHPEAVQARFDDEGGGIGALKRANEAIMGILQVLPHTSSKDVLSRTFCLWHPDLSPSNLLVKTHGPEAGQIVAVVDWEGAAVMPLWMVAKPPDFLSAAGQAGATDLETIYLRELERLDKRSGGLLVQAAAPEWDMHRSLVEAVLQPWSGWEAREHWLEEWRRRGKVLPRKRLKRSWTLGLGVGLGLAKRSQTM